MDNGVIYQPFSWYAPADPPLWEVLKADAPALAARGYSAVWLPPPYKGKGGKHAVGYGAYDLFDLGEFDQQGDVRTKYGTKAQLVEAVNALHDSKLQVYVDTVFNHKDGADHTEVFHAQRIDRENRNLTLGDWFDLRGWTRFTFPGRAGRYSTMTWHWWHFDSLSYDENHPGAKDNVYRIKGKSFETEVSDEYGNYDYLMACDVESSNPEVDGELRWWGRWIVDTLGVDGFRIDAVKHVRAGYFRDWLNHLRSHFGGRELFAVGEYWSGDVDDLHGYLAITEGTLSAFDAPLHYRFVDAGRAQAAYDLRTIFDRTLVREQPGRAVTFVDNHDTQPMQSLESWVEPWFKPLAYALILLRRDGYPCVFAGDLRESDYSDKDRWAKLYDHSFLINIFLAARRDYGFGEQHDYFDHPNTIGWMRLGTAEHPGAMAVVMSNGTDGHKWMRTWRAHATFRDATGHIPHPVVTNADGWGEFRCPGRSISVWLQN